MKPLKFAVLGCGFWATYQIPAWLELDGVELVALADPLPGKAAALGQRFGVTACYDRVDALLDRHAHELDFVDIITEVDAHAELVQQVAARGLNVICQKPMARSLAEAEQMMDATRHVKFYIHENFRWQAPMRRLKVILGSGAIGRPFKARVSFCTGFPDLYVNQPLLKQIENLIIADNGSHQLDLVRFFFGEATSLYCLTQRVAPDLRGEDVANLLIRTEQGVDCFVELSFNSIYERDYFPQTLILVEGETGSVHLMGNYEIRTTSRAGTVSEKVEPKRYDWLNPDYAVVHSSIVDCNGDILNDLRGTAPAETTAADNFKTVQLVFAAYESARSGQVVVPG